MLKLQLSRALACTSPYITTGIWIDPSCQLGSLVAKGFHIKDLETTECFLTELNYQALIPALIPAFVTPNVNELLSKILSHGN